MNYLTRDMFRSIASSGMLLALLFFPVLATAELSKEQIEGKQIYFQGTSPHDNEITAIVGTEGVSLPASAVPCASCHGPDGLGRREGGVIPPDIRWSELTKVYGHIHEDGRKHAAFDHSTLSRLIRTGIDPDDNKLDRSMPLYKMSVKDMRSLVAYIRVLEDDLDPGISKDVILIGTLLPLGGSLGPLGQAMAQVMHAHFKDINDRGGLFGRNLELLVIPYGNTPQNTLENLRSALAKEGIFAMVGAYTVGLDEAILAVLREEGVPLIGPFTLNPGDQLLNSASFYMYPGFDDQVQTLVQHAFENEVDGGVKIVLAGPEGESIAPLIAAVEDILSEKQRSRYQLLRYPAGQMDAKILADSIEKNASTAVLFLGKQAELNALLELLDERKLSPSIYLLSAFTSRPLFDAPASFSKRLFLAYPTTSSDLSDAGRSEYLRLADTHALPRQHLQGQVAAFAAAKLLVEGLRGAGRTLSRLKLEEAIEALYRYDTGMTPPLTYGPNRRIGARGAHILMVDLEKKTNTAVGGWREVK